MGGRSICREPKRIRKAGIAKLHKGKESCRGQALIEFTLVAMIFFLLSFAVIDFSWILFSQMNMQNAVREAARYASTGNHVADPKTKSNLSRNDSITQVLEQQAMGTMIDSVDISSQKGGAGSAGGPGDTVTIKAVCQIPAMTALVGRYFGSDNNFHYTVSATFKNEPFPASQTK